jgi:hypothetical protein
MLHQRKHSMNVGIINFDKSTTNQCLALQELRVTVQVFKSFENKKPVEKFSGDENRKKKILAVLRFVNVAMLIKNNLKENFSSR